MATGFVHEAFFYAGDDEFVAGTVPFIAEAMQASEPVMVAVPRRKIDLLESALGDAADWPLFVDMQELGGNPARILPAWDDFLAERAPGHRPVRGIGEPIGPDRGPAALLECQRNEVLLNAAFATRPAWWLLCPYDTTALRPEVIAEAQRSHPYLVDRGGHRTSDTYQPGDPAGFARPLPAPPAEADGMRFGHDSLAHVRRFAATAALGRGLDPARLPDLLVAINELTTNSVCHGGGAGSVRVWQDGATVVCEVSDGGVVTEPLVGRRRPDMYREGGRGLWIVHQLCDLVELRSSPAGTVVRIHMSRA